MHGLQPLGSICFSTKLQATFQNITEATYFNILGSYLFNLKTTRENTHIMGSIKIDQAYKFWIDKEMTQQFIQIGGQTVKVTTS